jgi:hypothetical protein
MLWLCLGTAALLFGFLILLLWQKAGTGLTTPDYGFVGVMVLMLRGAIWLFRALGREMNNPGT